MNADGTGQTGLRQRRLRLSAGLVARRQQIAFNSDRDGNNEIYVMNADGTGQTRLTNNADGDDQPAWSPDGSRSPSRATATATSRSTS